MHLTVIGSGTTHPNPTRNSASYLVEDGQNKILMDLGPGALVGLRRAGIDTNDLYGILITHRHADHCCELQWLMQLERTKARTRPLRIAAPGIFYDYLKFFESWGRTTKRPVTYETELNTMPGEVCWAGMEIKGSQVPHVEHSVGFRIRCDGFTLAYTGDSGPGDELLALAKDADLLISECTLAPGDTSDVHLNPEQVADLATKARVKKLLLSHFPPDADTPKALSICRHFGLDTMLAEDGLRIELKPATVTT